MRILTLFLFFMSAMAMGQNKIVAHRGAWKNTGAPQNSLAALKHSFEMGCGGTEFDINMTKDGVLVINHDADYFGKNIEEYTYAELNETKLKNGEDLPLLEDFLKMSKKFPKVLLFAEIKKAPSGPIKTAEACEKVYQMVKKYKALKRTVFITFSFEGVERLVQLDKKAQIQYLNGEKDPETLKAAKVPGLDYNHAVLQKHPDWIKRAKALGLSTNVWTVNKEEQMRHFLGEGIDFLTTDEPELALKLMK
jgi:glycerophosphoryl diester phosphodiesterase